MSFASKILENFQRLNRDPGPFGAFFTNVRHIFNSEENNDSQDKTHKIYQELKNKYSNGSEKNIDDQDIQKLNLLEGVNDVREQENKSQTKNVVASIAIGIGITIALSCVMIMLLEVSPIITIPCSMLAGVITGFGTYIGLTQASMKNNDMNSVYSKYRDILENKEVSNIKAP